VTAQLALPFPAELPAGVEAEALRRAARDRTRDCVARARERWPDATIPEPSVRFDLRGLTAGEACLETRSLRYNETLLLRHGREFLDEIIPHEVAHLVVAAVWPRRPRPRPHGWQWKEVMAFFGVPARRCHSFEAEPARRVRRFTYRCDCTRPHLLTKRAHLRIRRGTAEYRCRTCRNVLVRVEP
jgi:SprT protein